MLNLPKELPIRFDLLKVLQGLLIVSTVWAYLNLAFTVYNWKQTHEVKLVQVSPFISPLAEAK